MAKYESICELIERRIRLGDYALKGIPAEERLASEVGVSRMTARRAVMSLVDKGVLIRKPNGRLVVSRQLRAGAPQVALLMPAFVSQDFDRWRVSLERVCSKIKARLRKVDFVHWEDPVISETLDAFDGIFLLPGSEMVPESVEARLCDARVPLVVLDANWADKGLRSVDLAPAREMRVLMDHLASLGHRQIACLNTQPTHDVIRARMEQVAGWQSEHQLNGRMIDEPVSPYEDPMAKGYLVMSQFLQARRPDFTAIIATTMPAAVGAIRALHESGLHIGQDISICAAHDEGMARYLCPTLTSTQAPDPAPFLEVGLEWMLQRGSGWPGSLLLEPASTSLFVGESTGKCPA